MANIPTTALAGVSSGRRAVVNCGKVSETPLPVSGKG